MTNFLHISLDSAVTARMAWFVLACLVSTAQAQPQQAKDSDVQSCRFLNRVEGDSGYGKNIAWQGLAKAAVLKRAETLGASHVVFERLSSVGAFNGTASARAYQCDARLVEAGAGGPE